MVSAGVVVAVVAAAVSLAVDFAAVFSTGGAELCTFAAELLDGAELFDDASGLSPLLRLASFSADIVSP